MNNDVVDLAFALEGRTVAPDYADALLVQLLELLPWLAEEESVGVHPLVGLSTGPGEQYLSRRSRLVLRLPRQRVAAAKDISGAALDLGGPVLIGAAAVRELMAASVVYSSFVTVGEADEAAFLDACREGLAAMGLDRPYILCGKARAGRAAGGEWRGYSLLVHGLDEDASLLLQRQGLGGERLRGCGLFVPHKSLHAVSG